MTTYLYDCDHGQGSVVAETLETAKSLAIREAGTNAGVRNVHLATPEELQVREAMGGDRPQRDDPKVKTKVKRKGRPERIEAASREHTVEGLRDLLDKLVTGGLGHVPVFAYDGRGGMVPVIAVNYRGHDVVIEVDPISTGR